jgi:hypothetical protein
LRISGAEREKRNHADDNWDVRLPVKAGERDVQIAFLKITSALDETMRLPFLRPYPSLSTRPKRGWAFSCAAWRSSGLTRRAVPATSPSRRHSSSVILRPRQRSRLREDHPLDGGAPRYRRPVTDADVKPLVAMCSEGAPRRNRARLTPGSSAR